MPLYAETLRMVKVTHVVATVETVHKYEWAK